MKRRTLLTQVLFINLMLIAAAVIAAVIATNPDSDLRDTGTAGLVLGFALAVTIAINLYLLSRRFVPLERLADEMEQVNLSRPRETKPESIGGPEEVRRLEGSFRRMLDRLEAERHRSASAALEAQERERARVARDLHDEVNQSLTGLLLRLEALRSHAPPELSLELDETRAVASQAMQELLMLARQLRPSALDDLGLNAALAGLVEEVEKKAEIRASFETDENTAELAALPDEVQLVTYRVAQEALSNAIQHSNAQHVRVRLLLGEDGLELRVSDDGTGFSAEGRPGLGIAGMRERALLIGGLLDIETRPRLGTRVTLRLADADTKVDV